MTNFYFGHEMSKKVAQWSHSMSVQNGNCIAHVLHKNDIYHMSFEEIADWLEENDKNFVIGSIDGYSA